jgi:D-lyxose ketol-isomerase
MKELDKGLSISFHGPKAERALAAFLRQMEEWHMALPPVQPLLLDFGLGEFDHVGLIEYWIANEMQAGYCGKYLFVFDDQRCPMHRHRTKHETFYLMQGQLEVVFGEQTLTMRPGDVLPIPPGRFHTFLGEGNSLLLELSMPCEVNDNEFANPRTQAWLQRFA